MHPVNRVLGIVGLQVRRLPRVPPALAARFREELHDIRRSSAPFRVYEQPNFQGGEHPADYTEFECAFAAEHLARIRPGVVLDVGSYRNFIMGLAANQPITTLDVRPRRPAGANETALTGDAKALSLSDASIDAVVCLCALEHFGLGRYGDELDLEADRKALREIARVLRPGGHLILTTTITSGEPALVFNAHRIYTYPMIRALCAPLECVDERIYSHALGRFASIEECTREPQAWDVYCGCLRKPAG